MLPRFAGLAHSALSSARSPPSASPPRVRRRATAKGQAPGWYRLQLGEFEITALNDGALRVDSKLLQNITPKELAAALDRTYQTAPMVTSVTPS